MSWLYSRALVEEYSEANCSDGAQSALSSTSHTPRAYLSPDKMTDYSRLSRFGMTFAPLTDDLGGDLLTWFLAGFHARTLAQPEKAQESPGNGQGSGWKWRESSVKYDPNMHLWKTRQCSLLEDSEWFSETWPRWGLMRDGECWELPMSERPTFAKGSGLLPTIRSTDGERGGRGDLIQAVRGNPNSHYRLWQTPVADDAVDRVKGKMNSRGEPKLSAQVKMVPTPRAKSKSGGGIGLDGGTGSRKKIISELGEKACKDLTGGSLNPTWVEWLMGWPPVWTDLQPWATDKCHSAPPKRGAC